jgi:hypothetical protein
VREPEPVQSATTPESQTSERAALPPAKEEVTRTVRVLVVQRGSGKPIAGAELRCASQSELSLRDPHRPLWQPEIDDVLAPVGVRVTTDSHGEASIAPRRMPAVVDARFENGWGSTWFNETTEQPIRIEIEFDREIEILVVDGISQPVADVPVAIRSCPGDGPRSDLWSGYTGPDGVAHARHIDALLKQQPVRRMCVCLAVLARNLESVPLDPSALPTDPIRLTLPPTGSVEVVTVSEGSKPVFARDVQIGEASALDAHGLPGWSGGQYRADRIEDGHAEFAHVGLGLEIYATAFEPGFERSASRARGPQSAGERVEMVYDLGHAHPAIVIRLVDDKHAALPKLDLGMTFSLSHGGNSAGHGGQEIHSDGEGRIRVPMLMSATTNLAGTIDLRVTSLGPHEDWRATREIPAELHEGDNDLGDLVVKAPEPVASGVVVDDRGEPVRRAFVGVDTQSGSGDKWNPIPGLNASSNARGEFAVLGARPAGKLRLSANDREHAKGASVEAVAGARDVRIVLPRGAGLTGSLVLDASLPSQDLTVVVVHTREPSSSRREYDANDRSVVQSDGTFTLAGLRAGDVEVQIKCKMQREPLLSVEHIQLAPGVVTREPRLQHVDLREARSIHVDVVDEREAPIVAGEVWCISSTSDPKMFYFKDGKATVLARAASVDLEVRSWGYRSAHVRTVTGDSRVVLRRGFPVRVRLPDGFQLPATPRQLGLRLRLVRESGAAQSRMPAGVPDDSVDTFIEVGAESLVVVPAAGTYEMRWVVRADPETRTRARELANAHAEQVEISESDRERSVTGQPDAAELADALRALDQKP